MTRDATRWRIGGDRVLELDRPVVMGILNVTPDSFSDGGRYDDEDRAVEAATRLIAEGAGIIDVGGESTRPGAHRVPAEEQRARVVPVIRRLADRFDVPISVDTTLGSVARAAIEAGATLVNDVAAGTEDPELLRIAAGEGAGLVLMHRLRPPERDEFSDRYTQPPVYDDAGRAVAEFLGERIAAATSAGVADGAIAVDPGLGFGKSVDDNLRLLGDLGAVTALGVPVLVGASRKSFLGAIVGRSDARERDAASVAAAVLAAEAGARIIRVHAVGAHVDALAVWMSVRGRGRPAVGEAG